MRIACPPMIGSCYYGVDTPDREELISSKQSVEETREYIGADTLAYLPLDLMKVRIRVLCFSGLPHHPFSPLLFLSMSAEISVCHSLHERSSLAMRRQLFVMRVYLVTILCPHSTSMGSSWTQ